MFIYEFILEYKRSYINELQTLTTTNNNKNKAQLAKMKHNHPQSAKKRHNHQQPANIRQKSAKISQHKAQPAKQTTIIHNQPK